jgi:hypothetical protein
MTRVGLEIPIFAVLPDSSGKVSADCIDDCWKRNREMEFEPHVILDLSRSTYLTHDTLFLLGSFGRARAWKGQSTRLRLSQSTRLFDFLRSWHFFEYFANACDVTLEESLTRDSWTYLEAQKEPPRYVQMMPAPGGGYESLLLREQFEITQIDLQLNPLRAASSLRDRWLEVHLVGILERLLKRDERKIDGRRVATHIILEMVLNAASHPGAAMAYLSSQIDPPANVHAGRALHISVWDDGLSMADTLTHALRDVGSIQSPAYGGVDEVFEVSVTGRRARESALVFKSTQPELPRHPALLNVVAFMLGVSARPDEKRPSWVHRSLFGDPSSPLNDEMIDHGGLGLYLVRTTAIDLFGGTITYKTGHYRYRIDAGPSKRTYRVAASLTEDLTCPIKGNLLEVSLPLGEA